jgi:hypothetical protein
MKLVAMLDPQMIFTIFDPQLKKLEYS